MVNYIKVRPFVAQKLGVEDVRYRYADGNVLLWDKELRMVDPAWVFHPAETVARIGGLMMDPYRNREEQLKTAEECTPLPWPTDPDWTGPEEEAALAEAVVAAEETAEEVLAEEIIDAVAKAVEEAGEGGEP